MRPDNDEDVEADDKTEESRIDNVIVTVVKVANDLDEVEEEADDGQNKPGHHKSGLRLKIEMKIKSLFISAPPLLVPFLQLPS